MSGVEVARATGLSGKRAGARGLTLIELLAVMTIIAILAGLLIVARGVANQHGKVEECGDARLENGTHLVIHAGANPGDAGMVLLRVLRTGGATPAGEADVLFSCPLSGVGTFPEGGTYCESADPVTTVEVGDDVPIGRDRIGTHGTGLSINILIPDGRRGPAYEGGAAYAEAVERTSE
jgi:prepilin-type N-terminal cleavage/methylation domain-containing protein